MLVGLGGDGVVRGDAQPSAACEHAGMQTRYLILAALITGIVILIASALWLTRF